MKRISQFFTDIHNLTYEQTDLMGFFDPAGYGMPDCTMFHRSARIDRPASHIVEYSANCSVARTARHRRNRHSSGIFTFFSFEEGSNFVQNIRPHRTFFHNRRESLLFALNLLDDFSGGDEGIYFPRQQSTNYT